MLPRVAKIDHFLDDLDHGALLAFVLANKRAFESATIYEGNEASVQSNRRKALKLGGNPDGILSPFIERMTSIIGDLFTQVSMPKKPIVKFETEIACYNDGGFFHEHIDTLTAKIQSEQGVRQARALSAVYYFHREPKGFSGGDLRIWSFAGGANRGFIDFSPLDNLLVVFPSFAAHEVLPISCPTMEFADSRFAVNCWAHCEI